MSEEKKEKMVQAIANSVLNSLNINGIVEACKIYSINIAGKQYEDMPEEDKQKLSDSIDEAEANNATEDTSAEVEVEEAPVEVV